MPLATRASPVHAVMRHGVCWARPPGLVWIVEASSHFEAMTLYDEHMGWGEYSTDYPQSSSRPTPSAAGE